MLRLACIKLLITGLTGLFGSVPSPFNIAPGAKISGTADDTECVSRAIANLVMISKIEWKDFFHRTSCVEAILQLDLAGVYPILDFEREAGTAPLTSKVKVLLRASRPTELRSS